jgi:cysteinyl-tRNA synthetase
LTQSTYSAFDETGLPTKDAEGNELTKSASKTIRKEYDAQAKVHQKYLESTKANTTA